MHLGGSGGIIIGWLASFALGAFSHHCIYGIPTMYDMYTSYIAMRERDGMRDGEESIPSNTPIYLTYLTYRFTEMT